MKKIILLVLFALNISFVFANDIYDDYISAVNNNWEHAVDYINEKIDNKIIRSINYSASIINEKVKFRIELWLYSGNYYPNLIEKELIEEMKLYIKDQYFDNFYIYIDIIYPFIIIMNDNKKLNPEERKKFIMQINNELPPEIYIKNIFKYFCYGEIIEENGEPIDYNKFIEIINKYFGNKSIIEF